MRLPRSLWTKTAAVTVLAAVTMMLWGGPSGPRAAVAEDSADDELRPGDVDPQRSRVYVFVGKKRLGHEHAVEGRVAEGEIHVGSSSNPGEIIFDMTSFVADTDAALEYVGVSRSVDEDEQEDVTSTMRGRKVLDVEEHPTADFAISEIERLEEPTDEGHVRYRFTGEFTLHGETQDLEFIAATTEERDGRVRVQGDFTIKQTDYGIEPYSAFFGAVAVTNELKIYGDLWVISQ